MPFIPTTALLPGLGPQTETATTDPNTFTDTTTFDFGVPTVALITATASAFVPDGETFGDQPGDIMGLFTYTLTSADGVTWVVSTFLASDSSAHVNSVGGFDTPGQYQVFLYPAMRYLRFTTAIIDHDFNPYAGPNHPTVTFHITAQPVGSGGASVARPFIQDTETGIVVDRAGGFYSEWETFDLGEPGVGYGAATFTAADSDGLTWVTDILPAVEIAVSPDGLAWTYVYGGGGTASAIALDNSAAAANPPVGASLAYMSITPRFIRFRALILDDVTGDVYAGPDDPSLTFDFHYTAS